MIENNKVAIVMTAYNVAKTLRRTVELIPQGIVDDIILVDDGSSDDTLKIAKELGLHCVRHPVNRGYGGAQKTCYRTALERSADIVIMLHPDCQYNPRLVGAMGWMLIDGAYDMVIGSRFLMAGALKGGMPLYKFVANRFLTGFQNLLLRQSLSEYHTGYRAYRRAALQAFDYGRNSDDFVFDNQFLAQAIWHRLKIGEISCPAAYFEDASSMSFRKGISYGSGVLLTCLTYVYAKLVSPRGTVFDSALPARAAQGV